MENSREKREKLIKEKPKKDLHRTGKVLGRGPQREGSAIAKKKFQTTREERTIRTRTSKERTPEKVSPAQSKKKSGRRKKGFGLERKCGKKTNKSGLWDMREFLRREKEENGRLTLDRKTRGTEGKKRFKKTAGIKKKNPGKHA